jgi:hypothetical protein
MSFDAVKRRKLESAGEELAALTKIGPDKSSLFGGDICG